MRANRVGEVVVLPVDKKVIDVFTGNGWEDWSRFYYTGNYLKLIKGKGVSDDTYAKLMEMV